LEITDKFIELIFYGSLFVSAKYYLKDSKGPTAIDFQRQFSVKSQDILKMEKTILEKLGWNLMFKTTADYLEIFLV